MSHPLRGGGQGHWALRSQAPPRGRGAWACAHEESEVASRCAPVGASRSCQLDNASLFNADSSDGFPVSHGGAERCALSFRPRVARSSPRRDRSADAPRHAVVLRGAVAWPDQTPLLPTSRPGAPAQFSPRLWGKGRATETRHCSWPRGGAACHGTPRGPRGRRAARARSAVPVG